MNKNNIYKELLTAYENNDVDSFNRLNQEHNFGMESIEDVLVLEDRPFFNLSQFYATDDIYFLNYATSRRVVDLDKPVTKHKLKERYFPVNVKYYSITIYEVLTAIQHNPNIVEVMDSVELDIDKDVALDFLFSKGLIKRISDNADELKEMLENYSLPELRGVLKLNSLKPTGRRKEMVNRLVKFYINNDRNNVFITDYGMRRLRGVNWVGFYQSCLSFFDFDDYENYMKNNDTGDVILNSFNYLDDNLEMGYKTKDFRRIHDVLSSLAVLYINDKDPKKALETELKLYILRVNPIFLSQSELKDYDALIYTNIDNIITLQKLCSIQSLKDIFDDCWDDVKLDKRLLSKDVAFEYLTRALERESLGDLSLEIADNYF